MGNITKIYIYKKEKLLWWSFAIFGKKYKSILIILKYTIILKLR